MFALRFDLRNPAFAAVPSSERIRAAVEMAAWADEHGCVSISLSEHHGSDDGYLPSPVVLAAAMAARTRSTRIGIAALIAPFYDPLRLAEDLAVLDGISAGRIDLTVAGGYLAEEFDMFGVPITERARRTTEVVETLRLLQVSTAPIDRVASPPSGGACVGPTGRSAPGRPVRNGASRIGRFIPSGFPGYADVLTGSEPWRSWVLRHRTPAPTPTVP